MQSRLRDSSALDVSPFSRQNNVCLCIEAWIEVFYARVFIRPSGNRRTFPSVCRSAEHSAACVALHACRGVIAVFWSARLAPANVDPAGSVCGGRRDPDEIHLFILIILGSPGNICVVRGDSMVGNEPSREVRSGASCWSRAGQLDFFLPDQQLCGLGGMAANVPTLAEWLDDVLCGGSAIFPGYSRERSVLLNCVLQHAGVLGSAFPLDA